MTATTLAFAAAILAAFGVLIGHLFDRIHKLEDKQLSYWEKIEADAIIKREQGDHIDVLEHHIWQGNPPPPPARPPGI